MKTQKLFQILIVVGAIASAVVIGCGHQGPSTTPDPSVSSTGSTGTTDTDGGTGGTDDGGTGYCATCKPGGGGYNY